MMATFFYVVSIILWLLVAALSLSSFSLLIRIIEATPRKKVILVSPWD